MEFGYFQTDDIVRRQHEAGPTKYVLRTEHGKICSLQVRALVLSPLNLRVLLKEVYLVIL